MDIVGKRFGRLVVIKEAARKGYVTCRCDCGRVKDIRATQLTKVDSVQSCGCLQREIAKQTGQNTAKKNFSKFYSESAQYRTNFHVIESDKLSKNNKSGVTGIWYNEKRGSWEAYLTIHGTKIHLGRFKDRDEAIKARHEGEEKYFKPEIQKKNSSSEAK